MLVWACIAPHGGELIPELANGNLDRMAVTRRAMEELGARCRAARPESIVVYTPHGVCIDHHMCVTISRRTRGLLRGEDGAVVRATFSVDQELAFSLSERAAEHGIPVAQAAYDTEWQPVDTIVMDWGAFVPLWFTARAMDPAPQVVVVCPSRLMPREQLVDFGRATSEAASGSDKRVALICSADQGHGHAADGPYGFSETSATYDRAYCEAVGAADFADMLAWSEDWIESALPDSYWQTLMLHGALQCSQAAAELLSYEAPTYFGMACVTFDDLKPREPALLQTGD